MSLESNIKKILNDDLEIKRVGFSPLKKPATMEKYSKWLNSGYHAGMHFLKDHEPIKENPKSYYKFNSVLSFTFNYYNQVPGEYPYRNLRIASYAKGEDYHYWLKSRLQKICDLLKKFYPNESFEPVTDSAPLLERDYAYQTGLGWVGKNTCIIDSKEGSYFLLGEILTSLVLKNNSQPHPNRCGTCTACIDVCPTDALKPYELNSNKCISYLTIEDKSLFPNPKDGFNKGVGDWFFGCDLCQSVCPWNIKAIGKDMLIKDTQKTVSIKSEELKNDLLLVLQSSNKEILRKTQGTPLSRARGNGLKRNALRVILNLNYVELIEDLKLLNFTSVDLQGYCEVVIKELSGD